MIHANPMEMRKMKKNRLVVVGTKIVAAGPRPLTPEEEEDMDLNLDGVPTGGEDEKEKD